MAPGGGGEEEGGVDEGEEREERYKEGDDAAKIEKHGGSRWEYSARWRGEEDGIGGIGGPPRA